MREALQIIPAIDLRDGKFVRLVQGRREDVTVYGSDAAEIARSFAAEGAQMIHIVDLDGAFSEPNSRNRQVLQEIVSAVKIPIQFGGGLRSLENVNDAVGLGVARVVIGTMAVEAPELLPELVGRFGDRVCVGVDARDGQVTTRGWEKQEKISAVDFGRTVAAAGVKRIVYTDIARDGTLTGVNFEQTCAVARASGLKVTASGGVGSLADLERLVEVSECGIDSVIVGKALYEGRFTLREALALVGG